MAKIISIINHKGGVGKTTSTQNIGMGLHRFFKQRVLLIDLDSQANLTRSFGFLPPQVEKNIYHAITEDEPLPLLNLEKGLDLVPSSLSLSVAELKLSGKMGREYVLKNLLDQVQQRYDFVLIDCPPSLALLTINAIIASSDIYIPLEPEFLSLYGLDNINITLQEIRKQLKKNIDISGVFLTKFSDRVVLHQNALELAQQYFPKQLFQTKIRKNISLSEAQGQGKSIFDYAPKSNGAEDYKALVEEIIQRTKN